MLFRENLPDIVCLHAQYASVLTKYPDNCRYFFRIGMKEFRVKPTFLLDIMSTLAY